ncbi:MAG TPA: NADH-quinone oxidoreductase subunit C [Terracidiphilus sp.]|jgi:NADH:ubiquinone oxidoreductase subunit C|nr:NADH-quinone oxidoreductase subunit C [Terracidiphilus sp.]
MNSFESASAALGAVGPWREEGGVCWLDYPDLNVREVAGAMNAVGARFVTITAYQLPKEERFRLEYHWDLAGRMLGFAFNLPGNAIESIYDLCEAVDWIEREVHEGFKITFLGRGYEPLLLRDGDTLGMNMRDDVAR